jgi:hypothetical protein
MKRIRRTTSGPSGPTAASRANPIDSVARQLRAALQPVLRAAAGDDPRPMKLARAIQIDKSLASVLVRAVNAPSDRDLLHIVPSPTGLKILSERTKGIASRTATSRLESATERFRALLDATPGGRAALDAQISENSRELGWKRENTSKQATFKSMSFLLGYYSDLMASSLILVPSKDGSMVDGIEIIRRVGVHRMRSNTTIPLFNFTPWSQEEGKKDLPTTRLEPLNGDPAGPSPQNLLLPEYCTNPMPLVDVVSEGPSTAVVLPGTPTAEEAMDFAWAFRLANGGPLDPGPGKHSVHAYFLHMPTRHVVRDVFIAESVYAGAVPSVSWALPGTSQHHHPPGQGATRYYAQVDLDAEFEPLVGPRRIFAVPGMRGHDRLTQDILADLGHAKTRFRGWRCSLNYPVPLLEMLVWLDHGEGDAGK